MFRTRVAVVVGALAVLTAACGGGDETRVTDLEAQVGALQDSVRVLSERLADAETAAAEHTPALNALNNDVDALATTVSRLVDGSDIFGAITVEGIQIGPVGDGITIWGGGLAMNVAGSARLVATSSSVLGGPLLLLLADDGHRSILTGGTVRVANGDVDLAALHVEDGGGGVSVYAADGDQRVGLRGLADGGFVEVLDGAGDSRIELNASFGLGLAILSLIASSGQGPSVILTSVIDGAGGILIFGDDGELETVLP